PRVLPVLPAAPDLLRRCDRAVRMAGLRLPAMGVPTRGEGLRRAGGARGDRRVAIAPGAGGGLAGGNRLRGDGARPDGSDRVRGDPLPDGDRCAVRAGPVPVPAAGALRGLHRPRLPGGPAPVGAGARRSAGGPRDGARIVRGAVDRVPVLRLTDANAAGNQGQADADV